MDTANVIELRPALFKPGDKPGDPQQCASMLLECTMVAKLVRVTQQACHDYAAQSPQPIEHPDGSKHLTRSVTSREVKCSMTLPELTQLLLDCGASHKSIKAVNDKLRADGVGGQAESARWCWVKNEGSQSKSK